MSYVIIHDVYSFACRSKSYLVPIVDVYIESIIIICIHCNSVIFFYVMQWQNVRRTLWIVPYRFRVLTKVSLVFQIHHFLSNGHDLNPMRFRDSIYSRKHFMVWEYIDWWTTVHTNRSIGYVARKNYGVFGTIRVGGTIFTSFISWFNDICVARAATTSVFPPSSGFAISASCSSDTLLSKIRDSTFVTAYLMMNRWGLVIEEIGVCFVHCLWVFVGPSRVGIFKIFDQLAVLGGICMSNE